MFDINRTSKHNIREFKLETMLIDLFDINYAIMVDWLSERQTLIPQKVHLQNNEDTTRFVERRLMDFVSG